MWERSFLHILGIRLAINVLLSTPLFLLRFASELKCDRHDATCVKAMRQDARHYISKHPERWWEFLFLLMIILPIAGSAPYMLAECLKTYRVRCSSLFQSLADEAILALSFERFLLILPMFALVLSGTTTGSIYLAEDSSKDGMSVYQPFSLQKRIEQRGTGLHCKKHDLNFDIVGPGIRLSAYALLIFTVLSLTIGTFHSRTLGTKELGICTLLSR